MLFATLANPVHSPHRRGGGLLAFHFPWAHKVGSPLLKLVGKAQPHPFPWKARSPGFSCLHDAPAGPRTPEDSPLPGFWSRSSCSQGRKGSSRLAAWCFRVLYIFHQAPALQHSQEEGQLFMSTRTFHMVAVLVCIVFLISNLNLSCNSDRILQVSKNYS